MADTQEILIRYRADVGQLDAELDKIIDQQDEIIKNEKAQESQSKKTASAVEQSAKKRQDALKGEAAQLDKIDKSKRKAFDSKPVDQYTKSVKGASDGVKKLGSETQSLGSAAGNVFKGIAAGIVAAFSVQAVIGFAKQSIDAFLEAEKSLERLRFSVVNLGGESEAVFNRLVKQSEEIQKVSIFRDDAIQQAQAALSAFGLTGRQIEELIPKLADFATVTGVDITQAAQQVGAGLQGAGREFKKFGIEVSATNTPLENLVEITKGLSEQAGAAANSTKTLAGQLEQTKNRAGDLQERIGEGLAPAWVALKVSIFEATLALINYGKVNKRTIDDIQSTGVGAVAQVTENLKKQGLTTDQLIQRLEQLLEIRRKEAEREELNLELRSRAGTLTRSEAEQLREKLALQQGIVKGYENEIARLKELQDENARVLTSRQLEAASVDDLNKLLKENEAINDVVAQSNIANIEKELDARKKASEEARKQAEKDLETYRANLEKIRALDATATKDELAEIAKRDQAFLDSLEKRRKAQEDAINKSAQLSKEAQKVLTDQFLEDTSKEDLRTRIAVAKSFEVELTNDLNAEIAALNKQALNADFQEREDIANKIILLENATAERIAAIYQKLGVTRSGVNIQVLNEWFQSNAAILDATSALIGELNTLYQTFASGQIDEINRVKEAELASIDEQLKANDEALKLRRISEAEAAKNEKRLLDEKVKAEETAAKKEREIKRKQAILDKAAALIEITINTAKAVTEALPAIPLSVLMAALGAAQAAIVVAQPIPYKKGSKQTKEGLAMVGEEGPELTYMPGKSKVVPTDRTNKYGDVIDAMFDNNLDKYILKNYVTPALLAQKNAHEREKSESFADNVSKSLYYNATLNDGNIIKAIRGGQRITNADEIAEAIANKLTKSIYR